MSLADVLAAMFAIALAAGAACYMRDQLRAEQPDQETPRGDS